MSAAVRLAAPAAGPPLRRATAFSSAKNVSAPGLRRVGEAGRGRRRPTRRPGARARWPGRSKHDDRPLRLVAHGLGDDDATAPRRDPVDAISSTSASPISSAAPALALEDVEHLDARVVDEPIDARACRARDRARPWCGSGRTSGRPPVHDRAEADEQTAGSPTGCAVSLAPVGGRSDEPDLAVVGCEGQRRGLAVGRRARSRWPVARVRVGRRRAPVLRRRLEHQDVAQDA